MSQAAPEREPRPQLDVRVGSATNALQPISVAERSLRPGVTQWAALLVVAAAAFGADQLTKWIVSSELALRDAVEVVGPLRIHHVRNSGIAFGLFSDATSIVVVLTGIAVTAMFVYFARAGLRHPILPVALGLVLGGSMSNLFDRLRLGYVTDFLDVDYWPAFNLADTFIVLGVALLFVSFVAADRTSPRVGTVPLSRL
ncbi:MAG TPA: signal peptidase II [Gaiellaceae bacterium]|nr:signal peptidase II [Gaiellaceae bacterium]